MVHNVTLCSILLDISQSIDFDAALITKKKFFSFSYCYLLYKIFFFFFLLLYIFFPIFYLCIIDRVSFPLKSIHVIVSVYSESCSISSPLSMSFSKFFRETYGVFLYSVLVLFRKDFNSNFFGFFSSLFNMLYQHLNIEHLK